MKMYVDKFIGFSINFDNIDTIKIKGFINLLPVNNHRKKMTEYNLQLFNINIYV